jgi:NAD(P)-dependent dehydrogenase (short-subunit alcohol dehydrogenase family)
MSLDEWERVMDVNATGYFLTLREGLRLMKAQAIGGTVVVVASKNVFAPGKDFAAYSASKAAEVQLARIAAIEGAEYGVRVNCVNPDGIFGDSRLWTDGMKEQRATTYGIEPDQLEQFYAGRNLLRQPVTADDVAQAVLWLASDRSAKTTGAVIPVDAGVPAAFPR